MECYEAETGPMESRHSLLEASMEEHWKDYLKEEHADFERESRRVGSNLKPLFSFSATMVSKSAPALGLPLSCHPTEAESIPLGFIHHHQKTLEQ